MVVAIPPDHIAAIVAYLESVSEVTALTDERIYGLEMHRDDSAEMPQQAVLVTAIGGGVDDAPLMRPRADIICYGETPLEAMTLYRTVHGAMRALSRETQSSAFLQAANQSGGPISGREPDTNWPMVWGSWTVLVNETSVT